MAFTQKKRDAVFAILEELDAVAAKVISDAQDNQVSAAEFVEETRKRMGKIRMGLMAIARTL